MHHRQRHGHDGVLRVPQRDRRRPRRPGDARAARRLRRVLTAVEMEDGAANDDRDVDVVMMPSFPRCQSERMPFQAASRAYVHTPPHARTRSTRARVGERDPFSIFILPSIYRYCQKPDDLRSFVRGEEREETQQKAISGGCM